LGRLYTLSHNEPIHFLIPELQEVYQKEPPHNHTKEDALKQEEHNQIENKNLSSAVVGANNASGKGLLPSEEVFRTNPIPDEGLTQPVAAVAEHALSMPEPRRFYVACHNPNSLEEVRAALENGANALAPDINVYASDSSRLCMSHGEGDDTAPSLEHYLQGLHDLLQEKKQYQSLSLVIFDCKPTASKPEFGLAILTAIRQYLTYDTDLNIILSVAELSQQAIFDLIKDQLREREGLAVDEEDDPQAVTDFFSQMSVANQGYGNGISVGDPSITAPEARPAIERACLMRLATHRPRFVYAWTINDEELMREYIRIGVDGLITDEVGKLIEIVGQCSERVRMAKRTDSLMQSADFGYCLSIHTGKVPMAGTDAHLTFILQGKLGSARVTVDASLNFRMERGDWDYVLMPSPDLGELESITVQRDNQGHAPDWYLDRIVIESHRYGVAKPAVFKRWIHHDIPVTSALI
jgi:hypothetical protein